MIRAVKGERRGKGEKVLIRDYHNVTIRLRCGPQTCIDRRCGQQTREGGTDASVHVCVSSEKEDGPHTLKESTNSIEIEVSPRFFPLIFCRLCSYFRTICTRVHAASPSRSFSPASPCPTHLMDTYPFLFSHTHVHYCTDAVSPPLFQPLISAWPSDPPVFCRCSSSPSKARRRSRRAARRSPPPPCSGATGS